MALRSKPVGISARLQIPEVRCRSRLSLATFVSFEMNEKGLRAFEQASAHGLSNVLSRLSNAERFIATSQCSME